MNRFTTVDISCGRGDHIFNMVSQMKVTMSVHYIQIFDTIWSDKLLTDMSEQRSDTSHSDVFQVKVGLADACLRFKDMQTSFLRTYDFQKLVFLIKFCFFDRNILSFLYRQNHAVFRLDSQNHVFGM